MQQPEVTQWQSAMALYREMLDMPEQTRQQQIETLEVSPQIREKLRQLFRHAQPAEQDPLQARLDQLVVKLSAGASSARDAEEQDLALLGRDIGGWTLLEPLGRGGMAAVFKAGRAGVEFEQFGALKLLSLLLLATGGTQRFVREQQFLAKLHHPNIAMLLDGGVTADGTPFLVTELVDGSDILTWCRQRSLGARAVVRLLLQLCAAVSHAHGHLILHRDIKPSNVLVTHEGQVKLVDFGIGKLAAEADEGPHTRIFSPRFAAPEQMQGGAVTTATDVYGLGQLARCLLEDQLPGQAEIRRIIDMATRPEAGRRYASVESLARDLHNWLENRPISAVSDSLAYRVRKFVRRNRVAVAGVAAVILSTATGAAAVLWQADAARAEAEKANTLAHFMINVFASGDLLAGAGPETPIVEIMNAGARRARTELEHAPVARAEVLRIIGLAQTEFGEYDEAGTNLRAALDGAASPVERGKVLGALGVWAAERSEFEQGIAWMEEALQLVAKVLPRYHPDRLEIELNLINFMLFTGEHQHSMARADDLLAAVTVSGRLPVTDQANLLRSRGMALTQAGRFDEAIDSLKSAITLAQGLRPRRPALEAAYLNDLGNAFTYRGDRPAAIDVYTQSYQIQAELYGVAHKRTLTSGSNLVHALRSAGRLDQAITLGQTVLATSLASYGSVHRSSVLAGFALALALSDAGQNAAAEQQLTESIVALRQLDDLRSELPNQLAWLGELSIRSGHYEAAIAVLEEAEHLRETEYPDEPRRYRVAAQQRLVQAYAAQGQCEVANAYLGNIKAEITAGDPQQALATYIYMANCQPEEGAGSPALNAQVDAIGQTEQAASLRAALGWADRAGIVLR